MEFTDQLVPLLTLIALEVILGIDNIIFISILADKLPEAQRPKLRLWGIGMATVMRLGLLAAVAWIISLDKTLFTVLDNAISGKDLILLLGGIFLLYKATKEIYHKTEAVETGPTAGAAATFGAMLGQVLLLDLVFSVDSIITAVGMVSEVWVMYTAVIVTVIIMLVAAKPISNFISEHPSFKVLALCFLLIIGMSLVAEGLDFKIPKGYIYFSMAFSFLVDVIQMKTVKKKTA
ncbi:MAG: TerC family protein [Bacteroidetes bacterium]|nr:MAG: TerC family protein [Bacteroidota bacterium]